MSLSLLFYYCNSDYNKIDAKSLQHYYKLTDVVIAIAMVTTNFLWALHYYTLHHNCHCNPHGNEPLNK